MYVHVCLLFIGVGLQWELGYHRWNTLNRGLSSSAKMVWPDGLFGSQKGDLDAG